MNYKIKCVGYNGSERLFTIGKVYDVVDTVVTCDDGFRYERYKGDENVTIQQVVNWFKPWYEFEIVEDYKVGEVKPKCKDDSLKIQNVIFNNPATIVQWSDGSKTVVKCRGEEFDPEKGMAMAIAKKTLGDHYWDEFQKWVNCYDKVAAKEPKKPKYLNGKVVCVKTDYQWWTVGKVYDVVDGVITANDGDKYPHNGYKYKDYNDVRHAGAGSYHGENSRQYNELNTFVPIEECKNPLTLEEIKDMDGQKIWLSSMWNGEERFHDDWCGWHTVSVKKNRLFDEDDCGYNLTLGYGDKFGYKAYYNDMSKEK